VTTSRRRSSIGHYSFPFRRPWTGQPFEHVSTSHQALKTDDIQCIAFCAPNSVAAGTYDGHIVVWNIDSEYIRFTLTDAEARGSYEVTIYSVCPPAQRYGGES
jgi:hypothetical protein